MDKSAGVYRDAAGMAEGLKKVEALKKRFAGVSVVDKSGIYNTNLVNVLEIENLLDLAEAHHHGGPGPAGVPGGPFPEGFHDPG